MEEGEAVANRLQLAGVVGLVAPLAATLGLFKATGTIGRVQRDEPVVLLIAIGLVLIAGGLLTIASYLKGKKADGTEYGSVTTLFVAGAGCTVIGFLLALGLVVCNASAESRPRIAASLNQSESKLTAEVAASNLETSDRLAIKVDLARLKSGKTYDDEFPFAKRSLALERAYVGPNSDGEVKETISIPVPGRHRYTIVVIKAFTGSRNSSCREQPALATDPGTGCMFLALDPRRAAKARTKAARQLRSARGGRPR